MTMARSKVGICKLLRSVIPESLPLALNAFKTVNEYLKSI